MRERVPWWLPLMAIPFWGAVLWLQVNSPFRLGQPEPELEDPPAARDLRDLRGCVGAEVIYDAEGRLVRCEWRTVPTIRPRYPRQTAPLGDFPTRRPRTADFGKAEHGFPTLRLQ